MPAKLTPEQQSIVDKMAAIDREASRDAGREVRRTGFAMPRWVYYTIGPTILVVSIGHSFSWEDKAGAIAIIWGIAGLAGLVNWLCGLRPR